MAEEVCEILVTIYDSNEEKFELKLGLGDLWDIARRNA